MNHRSAKPLLALLAPAMPEEEALRNLKALRAEEKQFLEKQIELEKEEVKARAHQLRTLLYEVQLRAMHPKCINRAALFSTALLPMRQRPEVYAKFTGLQRSILASYPSNDDQFDWAEHLLSLQIALYNDETDALRSAEAML